MVQLLEEHYLTVCSLCICRIWKGVKIFFKGFYCFGLPVYNFPDVSVGSTTYFFDELVLFKDMWLYFLGHDVVIDDYK